MVERIANEDLLKKGIEMINAGIEKEIFKNNFYNFLRVFNAQLAYDKIDDIFISAAKDSGNPPKYTSITDFSAKQKLFLKYNPPPLRLFNIYGADIKIRYIPDGELPHFFDAFLSDVKINYPLYSKEASDLIDYLRKYYQERLKKKAKDEEENPEFQVGVIRSKPKSEKLD